MAIGQIKYQPLRSLPRPIAAASAFRCPATRHPQRDADTLTTDLFRGINDRFQFFSEGTAERYKALQEKWDRSLQPTFFDKLRKSVTGSPFILPAEAREFAKLRAIACLQSFSDDKSIAMSYAGDKGYLLRLTVPLMESWRFMESRSLMVDGHALYTDVYFIPSQLITRNVSSGDWRLTIKHLGR